MNPSDMALEQLLLHAAVQQHISDYTYDCLPEEACGVLIGHSSAISRSVTVTQFTPVKNTAEFPLHSFHLDPVQWTRLVLTEKGIIGLFHSHPHTSPEPSGEDLLQLPSFGGLLQVYAIGSPAAPNAPGLKPLQLHAYKIMREKETAELDSDLPSNSWVRPAAEFYSLTPIPCQIK
ncbi:M67 family metallopeptidase [Paenibacillus sp. 2KB_20]|uniref:M67 family metallopeptidase n=1 Tax=Paenibacillus sp. 2KB_20 TaxID=3232977 RepID=UPI003F9C4A64